MAKVIASVGSKRSTLVFQLVEYKGTRTLDIRKHYLSSDSDELIPTRKGISLAEKTFAIVQNVLEEYGSEIGDWLDGAPSVAKGVRSEYRLHSSALQNLRHQARSAESRVDEWKSPDFFRVEAEGGCDRLVYNKAHDFYGQLSELLDALIESETCDDRKRLANQLVDLVTLMLVAFERARRLFSGSSEIPANVLFDTLHFNWGSILGSQIEDGEGQAK